MKILLALATLMWLGKLWTGKANALPINFGITQDKIEYNQIMAKDFSIYVDSRVKHEGPMILNSLEAAKPVFESWFEKNRGGKPLPVISSAVTSNASFANWIFDQVELQTMGQFERDLAWHEYTHSTMYLHFYNIFGPPGATLNLIWMPSWYIEGLAETLSVSSRSTTQMILERYHALSGDWPSYDKLHSLYIDGTWAARGYPIVGSFVRWLSLRGIKKNPELNPLPAFLKDFRFYSAPWLWPWAVVPFNGFMPFDRALENQLGKGGADLWETYKSEATTFWQNHRISKLHSESKSPRLKLAHLRGLFTSGNQVLLNTTSSIEAQQFKEIQFDSSSDWAIKAEDTESSKVPSTGIGLIIKNSELEVTIETNSRPREIQSTDMLMARNPGGTWKKIAQLKGVERLFDTGDRIAWSMWHREDTYLCFLVVRDIKRNLASESSYILKPNCKAKYTLPKTMNLIGTKTEWDEKLQRSVTEEIWFKVSEQTLLGDRFKLLVWRRNSNSFDSLTWDENSDPLKVAFSGSDTWILTADGLTQSIKQIGQDGACLLTLPFDDYLASIYGLTNGELVLALHDKDGISLKKVTPRNEKSFGCPGALGQMSPIIYALRKTVLNPSKGANLAVPSFGESMLQTDLWSNMSEYKATLAASLSTKKSPESALLAQEVLQNKGLKPREPQGFTEKNSDESREIDSKSRPDASQRETLVNDAQQKTSSEKTKEETTEEKTRTEPVDLANSTDQELKSDWDKKTIEAKTALTAALPLDQNLPLDQKAPLVEDSSKVEQSIVEGEDTPDHSPTPEPYKWKARPALLFPWLGGEDPLGLQMGIISIPLVDSLQNETVRATVLVGLESKFPAVDVTLTSNRFKTLLSLSAYKQQTYNGFIRDPSTGEGSLSYYDEEGVRFEAANYLIVGDQVVDYSLGIKGAHLKRLYGPNLSRIGTLFEPGGSFSTSRAISKWRLGLSMGGTFTTESMNKNFDYNKLDTTVSLSRRILKSQLIFGAETSRTRGKKMPFLKELYTPLKTFIPGSGGGINQNNFAVTPTNGLLSSTVGDSQGRAKINWTMPIIESIEKHYFIFYFDRLDFSAFFNYGGAWNQSVAPPSGTVFKAAHGYNLDLQFENKGFKLSAGLGVGQLIGNPYEVFAKFSFDNYF